MYTDDARTRRTNRWSLKVVVVHRTAYYILLRNTDGLIVCARIRYGAHRIIVYNILLTVRPSHLMTNTTLYVLYVFDTSLRIKSHRVRRIRVMYQLYMYICV